MTKKPESRRRGGRAWCARLSLTGFVIALLLPGRGGGGEAPPAASTGARSAASEPIHDAAGIGLDLVLVPAGSYAMGSRPGGAERGPDETRHRVSLTHAFYLSATEITQAQWRAVMGGNPAHFSARRDDRPVEKVSWYDAIRFCNRLSALAGLRPAYVVEGSAVEWDPAAPGYRLPTEAEWEYACRAGTRTPFATGMCLSAAQANYDGTKPFPGCPSGRNRGRTRPVGKYAPNAWGVFDMHGNVWEWCWDWYGSYGSDAARDPRGPRSGTKRVIRGGSWLKSAEFCRSANRSRYDPGLRSYDIGFRVARFPNGSRAAKRGGSGKPPREISR
jgi:sulfatase modifying factor 1